MVRDLPEVWYHGASERRAEETAETGFPDDYNPTEGAMGPGVYLTTSPKTANLYGDKVTRSGRPGAVLAVSVEFGNPYVSPDGALVDNVNREFGTTFQTGDQVNAFLRSKGYDAIIVHFVQETWAIVFDPTKITYVSHQPSVDRKDFGKAASENYWGGHRPDENGPSVDNLLGSDMLPKDVYQHPEYYTGFSREPWWPQNWAAILAARGNPNALVTIYRSLPPGHTTIANGDWVALAKGYAQMHGEDRGWEEWTGDGNGWVQHDGDWPVISAQVPAHTVRFAGDDLVEWGYFGPDLNAHTAAVAQNTIERIGWDHGRAVVGDPEVRAGSCAAGGDPDGVLPSARLAVQDIVLDKVGAQAVCPICGDIMGDQVAGMTCMMCGTIIPFVSADGLDYLAEFEDADPGETLPPECTCCGGTGEHADGHECYACDASGQRSAQAEGYPICAGHHGVPDEGPDSAKERYGDGFEHDVDPVYPNSIPPNTPGSARTTESSWEDVRDKAKRIRESGGVHIVSKHDNLVVGEVQGDHGTYTSEIDRNPGRDDIAYWSCTCEWNTYAWGRSGPWKKYEGRVCSHVYALELECLSRGMFGQPISEDKAASLEAAASAVIAMPSWRDRGAMPDAEAVIAPDISRDGRRYLVYTYSEPVARFPTLAEAKKYLEDIYGTLPWRVVGGDTDPHYDPVWGMTDMFNDASRYYVVDHLPRLGLSAHADFLSRQISSAEYGHVDPDRLGQCYALAGRYIIDHYGSDLALVHGTIQGFGAPPLDHAWVRFPDGRVWEPATNTIYSPGDFQVLFNPQEVQTYSGKEAMSKMVDTGHFGPWDRDITSAYLDAPGGTIYRGLRVDPGDDFYAAFKVYEDESEVSERRSAKAGEILLDKIAATHMGVHWTERPEFACGAAAAGGTGAWGELRVVIEATYDPSDVEPEGSDAYGLGGVWMDSKTEAEVLIKPGADLDVTGVWVPYENIGGGAPQVVSVDRCPRQNWVGGPWANILAQPEQRQAAIQASKKVASLSAEVLDESEVAGWRKFTSTQEFLDFCRQVLDTELGVWVRIEDGWLPAPKLNDGILAEAAWVEDGQYAYIGWSVAGWNVGVALHECAHVIAGFQGVDDGHGPHFQAICDRLEDAWSSQRVTADIHDTTTFYREGWQFVDDLLKSDPGVDLDALLEQFTILRDSVEVGSPKYQGAEGAIGRLTYQRIVHNLPGKIASGSDLRAAAQALLTMAQRNEPDTTTFLEGEAAAHGGELEGLEFKIKSLDSLLRKMQAEAHEFDNDAGMTAANMSDSLRYTMVLDPNSYTQAVEDVISDMQGGRYRVTVKNYWEKGDAYQGINCACITPMGHPFELQFHTPDSLDVKENKVHPIYEQWRVLPDSDPHKAELAYQMRDISDSIPVPSGVLSIPTLTRQPMPVAAALAPAAYKLLTTVQGSRPTTLVRMLPNSAVEVYKDGQWVSDSEYGRYFFLGEPRADDVTPEQAQEFIDGLSKTSAADDDDDPSPEAAGLILKALDTGRILMIQRSFDDGTDEEDPNAGLWEAPGGHIDDEDDTPLDAAVREWEEETGQEFPGGDLATSWDSDNGVYRAYVITIPSEADVDFSAERSIQNPDGDYFESVAWWEIDHAEQNPALRPECKDWDWDSVRQAGGDTMTDSSDNDKTAAAAPAFAAQVDGVRMVLFIGSDGNIRNDAGNVIDPSRITHPNYNPVAGLIPGQATVARNEWDMGLDGTEGQEESVRQAMLRVALKDFSPVERQQILDEGKGVLTSNFDRLDLTGTHYEQLAAAEDDPDEFWGLGTTPARDR